MVVPPIGFLIAHRLLLVGLPDPRPLLAEFRPPAALPLLLFSTLPVELGIVAVPLLLLCGEGEARVTDGSGLPGERFDETACASTFADRDSVFAVIFFAAGALFWARDLAAALSFSR